MLRCLTLYSSSSNKSQILNINQDLWERYIFQRLTQREDKSQFVLILTGEIKCYSNVTTVVRKIFISVGQTIL